MAQVIVADKAGACFGVERAIELVRAAAAHAEGDVFTRFAAVIAEDSAHRTTLGFRPRESTLKIDRKFSGSRRAIIHQRRAEVNHAGGRLKLRLILDRYSVEAFVNDGEKVLSATLATPLAADGIRFFCDGRCRVNVRCWQLRG